MINRYKRTARSFQELGFGDLESLDTAIPELALSHGVRQISENVSDSQRPQRDSNPRPDATTERDSGISAAACAPACTSEQGDSPFTAQSESSRDVAADPVELALARALEGAAKAGEWSVVAELARQLEARRLARQASVVSLDAERAKRSKGG